MTVYVTLCHSVELLFFELTCLRCIRVFTAVEKTKQSSVCPGLLHFNIFKHIFYFSDEGWLRPRVGFGMFVYTFFPHFQACQVGGRFPDNWV